MKTKVHPDDYAGLDITFEGVESTIMVNVSEATAKDLILKIASALIVIPEETKR